MHEVGGVVYCGQIQSGPHLWRQWGQDNAKETETDPGPMTYPEGGEQLLVRGTG